MKNNILIVDDEPLNLELMDALLAPEGYSLMKAANGEKALEMIRDAEPDLVLLDIMMPGMTGYSVLQEIRGNEKTRNIPVILLTALTGREDRLRGFEAGADDFISKPFDKTELVSRVKTHVRLSVLRRQINEKEKLNSIMDLIRESVVVTDETQNILQMNNNAFKLLGLENPAGNLADILFERYGSVPEIGHDKGSFILDGKGPKTGTGIYLSVEYYTPAGQSADKSRVFYVFILKDVTDEHTVQKMKLDFLAMVSDKLRTPLTVISGFARILGFFAPDERLQDGVKAILRSSEIMEKLIKRIMFFVELENTPAAGLNDVMDLKLFADRNAAGYKKTYELITAEPSIKAAYWQKIAAEELIENSFKFCDKEKVVLKVLVGREQLVIEDNGPGIPETEREKVFETFYQVCRDLTGTIAGAGLGLSIVKKLSESAGYSVELGESDSGGLKVTIGARN
jgi:DNA-binding response OmpR family regulator/anti-sigma regulatory factor (Ser/Thr protein kinase)